jgi:hypothetical protein
MAVIAAPIVIESRNSGNSSQIEGNGAADLGPPESLTLFALKASAKR